MTQYTRKSLKQEKSKALETQNFWLLLWLPFFDMKKDFVDSFKPYKSFSHLKRDLFQLGYGFFKTVRGLATMCLLPFLLLATFFESLYTGVAQGWKPAGKVFLQDQSIAVLLYASGLMLQGVMQILTAPLTWIFRVPFRLLRFKEYQPFKNNIGLGQAIEAAEKALTQGNDRLETGKILLSLHAKVKKAHVQGQPCHFSYQDYKKHYPLDIDNNGRMPQQSNRLLGIFEENPSKNLNDHDLQEARAYLNFLRGVPLI